MVRRDAASGGASGEDTRLRRFGTWCKENSVELRGCSIKDGDDGDGRSMRGVYADRAIKAGEVVVQVDDDACLWSETSDSAEAIENAGLSAPANEENRKLMQEGLVFAVMLEQLRGKASRWAPYLDVLPRRMDLHPIMWSAEEGAALKGTGVEDLMRRYYDGADGDFALAVEESYENCLRMYPELGLPSGDEGLALYHWASAIVAGYAFKLGEEEYEVMVPMFDMLNHRTGRANVRLHHSESDGVLQMVAVSNVPKGGELINTYGEHSDAALLRHYGFFEKPRSAKAAADPRPTNRHNEAVMPAGALVRSCYAVSSAAHSGEGSKAFNACWRAKIKYLQNRGLLDSDEGCGLPLHVSNRGVPSEALLEAVRILALPTYWFRAIRKLVIQAHGQASEAGKTMVPLQHVHAVMALMVRSLRRAARTTLRRHVRASARTNAAAEEKVKAGDKEGDLAIELERMEAAEWVRAGEADCLSRCLDWLGSEASLKHLYSHDFSVISWVAAPEEDSDDNEDREDDEDEDEDEDDEDQCSL